MSCTFRVDQCKNLEEGLRSDGLVFAQDWGPGSGAKKFFLTTCWRTLKDGGACVEQRTADLAKKHTCRHTCQISDLAEFLVSTDQHRYEVCISIEWSLEHGTWELILIGQWYDRLCM